MEIEKLVSADDLREWLKKIPIHDLSDGRGLCRIIFAEDFERAMASFPGEAIQIVRCKECGHAERYERTDGTAGYYCGHPQNTFAYGERWDRVLKPAKEADDFCSYGERREE